MTPDDPWRTLELRKRLEAAWHTARVGAMPPLDVRAIDHVDSTNTRLLEAARADAAPHLRLLVAQAQTAGRGRMGRAWHASPGASLAFSLAVPVAARASMSLLVGAAVADALEPDGITHDPTHLPPVRDALAPGPDTPSPRVALKWPNDLWLRDTQAPMGGRKLGGILLETTNSASLRALVVGIGLNLRAPTPEVAPGYGVASLDELAEGADDPAFASDVLMRVAPTVLAALLRPVNDTRWREAWVRRDLLAGRRVTAAGGSGHAFTGLARGIDDDGALLIERDDDGQIIVVSSGEVSVRPLERLP